MIQQFYSWMHSNGCVYFWSPKRMYWNVCSSTLHNSSHITTTQMTITSRMDKSIMRPSPNGLLYGSENNCSAYSSPHDPHSQSAEQKLSTANEHILYDSTYTKEKNGTSRANLRGWEFLFAERGQWLEESTMWRGCPGFWSQGCANFVNNFQAVYLICLFFFKYILF